MMRKREGFWWNHFEEEEDVDNEELWLFLEESFAQVKTWSKLTSSFYKVNENSCDL